MISPCSRGKLLGLVKPVCARGMFLKVFRHPKRKASTSLANLVSDVAIWQCNGPQIYPLLARYWRRKD